MEQDNDSISDAEIYVDSDDEKIYNIDEIIAQLNNIRAEGFDNVKFNFLSVGDEIIRTELRIYGYKED